MPGGGKPYALNLLQRRHLHRDRAGLRRPDQRVLFVRPRHRAARARSFPPAAACGDAAARRSLPTARVYLGTGDGAVRSAEPAARQRHRRREARRQASSCSSPTTSARRTRTGCGGATSTSTPRRSLFDYRGRKFLVGTSKECRLWLLDRDALGGEDHRTTLHTTPLICNDAQAFDGRGVWGALSAWQDGSRHAVGAGAVLGTGEHAVQGADRARASDRRRRRRVQAASKRPASGSWRRPGCRATWISRRKRVIANGVVFAYAAARTRRRSCPTRRGTSPAGRSTAAASTRARPAACRARATRRALRARRADRQGALVERQRRSSRGITSAD